MTVLHEAQYFSLPQADTELEGVDCFRAAVDDVLHGFPCAGEKGRVTSKWRLRDELLGGFCRRFSSVVFVGGFRRWFLSVVFVGGFRRWFLSVVFVGGFRRWFLSAVFVGGFCR